MSSAQETVSIQIKRGLTAHKVEDLFKDQRYILEKTIDSHCPGYVACLIYFPDDEKQVIEYLDNVISTWKPRLEGQEHINNYFFIEPCAYTKERKGIDFGVELRHDNSAGESAEVEIQVHGFDAHSICEGFMKPGRFSAVCPRCEYVLSDTYSTEELKRLKQVTPSTDA